MKRTDFSKGNRNGRHFTKKGLLRYRIALCEQLRKEGKESIACIYESQTINQFAAQGGYVIVERIKK